MSAGPTDPESRLELCIDDLRHECTEIVTVTLVRPNGGELPAWSPGAHVDLLLHADLTRQYSLSGVPQDRTRYDVTVLRDPASRGGSDFVHDRLAKGDLVAVSAPRNTFPLRAASSYVFVAGGIGITPIVPMLAQARRDGVPYQLAYAGRSRAGMAFLDVLPGDERLRLHVSDEGTRLDLRELVDRLDPEAHVYACGPVRLLDELAALCGPGRLHVEHFSGAAVDLDASAELSFDVVLSRSGATLTVAPDQTILAAVLASGVAASTSCAEGVCGSCETTVLEGDIDHRDLILDDDERSSGDSMMICCSRAYSPRLVLDL